MKLTKVLAFIIPAAFLFAMLFGANAGPNIPEGQVIGLQMGTVIHGIKSAIAGKPGTDILTDGRGHYVFQWATQYSGNFACFDASGTGCVRNILSSIKAGGNATNVRTLSEFRTFLIDNGWKSISPSDLPAPMQVLFSSTVAYLAQMATNWGTFLILPAGIFDIPEDMLPNVQEIG